MPAKIQSIKARKWHGENADFTRFTELKTLKLGQNAKNITSLKLPIHIKELEFKGSSFDSSFGDVLDLSGYPELEEIRFNLSRYKENVIREIKLPPNIKKVVLGKENENIKIANVQAVKNGFSIVFESNGKTVNVRGRKGIQEIKRMLSGKDGREM